MFQVTANAAAMPSFDGATLRFNIKSMSAKVNVIDSAIGTLSETVLNFVTNVIIKYYVLPEINEVGAKGISLPQIDFFKFVNTEIQLQPNTICLSSDLKRRRHKLVKEDSERVQLFV